MKVTPKEPGRPGVPTPLWYNHELREMRKKISRMNNCLRNQKTGYYTKRKKCKYTEVQLRVARLEYRDACRKAIKVSFRTFVSGIASQSEMARFARAMGVKKSYVNAKENSFSFKIGIFILNSVDFKL